ncbi:MAG: HAD family phosphatase [Lachnospiraceae bacterium]|nr:HAD family phosphatase [Lachnospiraceae bacterium]
MDGVLFDTERVCMESWVAVAQKRGMKGMREVFPLCIGRNAADDERIIREHYGSDFDYEGFMKEASGEFWRRIEEDGRPVKKGVRELLTYLKDEDWKVGLASSTKREAVERHLKDAGLSQYFSYVIGGDEIKHSKPEPDIYLTACKKLGTKPEETYAIEDSYNGIKSASRAAMMPIMVPDLLSPNEEMKELSTVILPDLIEVMNYFRSIF